jgi:WD40 repeat protein
LKVTIEGWLVSSSRSVYLYVIVLPANIWQQDDLIVSGSNDCKIKLWSASTGDCLLTLVGHDLLVRALSFEPRSGRLVSASYDKTVKVWDLGTSEKREGKLVREFRNCHVSHIFDVKFDVGKIVRCVLPRVIFALTLIV